MRKLVVLSVLIVFSFSVDEAFGCVCVTLPNQTPKQIKEERLKDFRTAAAVFAGEVVALDKLTVKFKVNSVWKGQETEETTMLTGTIDNGNGSFTMSSCDYTFEKGQTYLVYAYGPPERLKTHSCSRTALQKHAKAEINALDEIAPHKVVVARPK